MHYEILDKQRTDILPILKNLKDKFYLAGGTGLALLIGHRDSIDFDFFTKESFDTAKLYNEIHEIFKGNSIVKTQDEKNTLSIIVNEQIKISFFTFPYPIIGGFVEDENFRIASILDIACMKLSAIVSRSVLKDYVDIYFIFKLHGLAEILKVLTQKMPDLDHNLALKSLIYFDDVVQEEIIFKNNNHVSKEEIRSDLEEIVKKLA